MLSLPVTETVHPATYSDSSCLGQQVLIQPWLIPQLSQQQHPQDPLALPLQPCPLQKCLPAQMHANSEPHLHFSSPAYRAAIGACRSMLQSRLWSYSPFCGPRCRVKNRCSADLPAFMLQIYLWAQVYAENWSAFAPDFEELEENIELVEQEDEFDVNEREADKAKAAAKAASAAGELLLGLCTGAWAPGR